MARQCLACGFDGASQMCGILPPQDGKRESSSSSVWLAARECQLRHRFETRSLAI